MALCCSAKNNRVRALLLGIAFAMQYLQSSLYPLAAAASQEAGFSPGVVDGVLTVSACAGLGTVFSAGRVWRRGDIRLGIEASLVLGFVGLATFTALVAVRPGPALWGVIVSLVTRGLLCGVAVAASGVFVQQALLGVGRAGVVLPHRSMFGLTATQGMAMMAASLATAVLVGRSVVGPLFLGLVLLAAMQLVLRRHWGDLELTSLQIPSRAPVVASCNQVWPVIQHVMLGLLLLTPMPYMQTIWSYVLAGNLSDTTRAAQMSGVTLAIAGAGTICAGVVTKRLPLSSARRLMVFGASCVACGWSVATRTPNLAMLGLSAFVVGVGFGCCLAGFLSGSEDMRRAGRTDQIAQMSQITLYLSSAAGPLLATLLRSYSPAGSLLAPVVMSGAGGVVVIMARHHGGSRYSSGKEQI